MWLREWIYCKGSMIASIETLHTLWFLWHKTLDARILEFIACSETPYPIFDFLIKIKEEERRLNKTEFKANNYAYVYLFTIAKHAKNDVIFNEILYKLDLFKPK